jgi:spore maturation protein CgeB
MRITIFCHSLWSDWNHGNAHFLRGVVAELLDRGHEVATYEPRDGWSKQNLLADGGRAALDDVAATFPWMRDVAREYDLATLDYDRALDGADLVLVHEWSDPELVARVGARRAGGDFRLLFHDTHHRAVSRPSEMARYDLRHYDGVLAFGAVIRDLYLERGWAERAWTWHEAADTRVFRPTPVPGTLEGGRGFGSDGAAPKSGDSRAHRPTPVPGTLEGGRGFGDLVWIGNWGDDERTAELREFLLVPARRLRLQGSIHGVRYPRRARWSIRVAGLRYRGWLPNHRAPEVFARHRVTVHVPRRPYVEALPGIPTIRPFEAMACGIPLVSAPWEDADGLFRPGTDHLVARDGAEMRRHLREVLHDEALAASLRAHGLETIREGHTCAHRVDELEAVARELEVEVAA